MASNKELMAEVAALKAQLEEMRSQPVVVHEKVVYVDRPVIQQTRVPKKQELLELLFSAERVHAGKIATKMGISTKNRDTLKRYLVVDGWNIKLDAGFYSIEDCPLFRKFAQLEGAPEWMRFKLEIILARENAEAEVKARFGK